MGVRHLVFTSLVLTCLLVFSLPLVGCRSKTTNPWGAPATGRDPQAFVISPDLFLRTSFLEHAGPGPFGSYLAQNLHHPPFADLRLAVEARLGRTLAHRGEAHLTLVTPPEYDQVLKSRLTMDDLHALARDADVQGFDFEPLCVGRALRDLEDGPAETYFVVVRSEAARQLRRRIRDLFVERGGSRSAFDPELYEPHITLGFTTRDLHREDGVRKDDSSCWQPLYVDGP